MTLAAALNQKTAGHVPFADFLDLAAGLGCVGVEPRNDLGRPIFDGLSPAQARGLAADRGLRLLSLCEVYGFNAWSDETEARIATLVDLAEASGAEAVSLIPSVDDRPVLEIEEALRRTAPLFAGRAVTPLVEVIGFASSTLSRKRRLVDAMDRVGGPFRLIHDTFQHAISGERDLFPDHTRMVHISGISDPSVPLDESQDCHRVLVDRMDRCGTISQMSGLMRGGYSGPFSIETTERSVSTSQVLSEAIAHSLTTIRGELA
ncbi:TIM barrel protein [Pseudooceanicola sp. LIPI14-2-Ac024]|uniref:TIM barrel protein n=1 Tax=Pseudooceanicola sp. LIPI14-2-Ac024 TaxID=3344875 RepID=UPI0035D0C843